MVCKQMQNQPAPNEVLQYSEHSDKYEKLEIHEMDTLKTLHALWIMQELRYIFIDDSTNLFTCRKPCKRCLIKSRERLRSTSLSHSTLNSNWIFWEHSSEAEYNGILSWNRHPIIRFNSCDNYTIRLPKIKLNNSRLDFKRCEINLSISISNSVQWQSVTYAHI